MSIVSPVPQDMLAMLFGVHDPDRQGRVWIAQRYGNFVCFLWALNGMWWNFNEHKEIDTSTLQKFSAIIVTLSPLEFHPRNTLTYIRKSPNNHCPSLTYSYKFSLSQPSPICLLYLSYFKTFLYLRENIKLLIEQ
jgi:hypothetical protein